MITGPVGCREDSVHSHSEEISVFSLKIGVPGISISFQSAEISDEAIEVGLYARWPLWVYPVLMCN